MRSRLAPLALLAAGTLILYSANIGHAPIYLHEAEVLFALHAQSIATTLHDTNGRLLPLYFQMPQVGENVWFHPMVVYAMVPFLKVLPLSETAIRLPSALVGLTDVVLIYFIAARIFRSDRWGLLAAALLALTPSHFIHSRLAMDYLHPVPFVLAWLLCLLIFLERRNPWLLFAATSFLGGGLYSYIASVVMMPLYLVMTVVVIWTTIDRPARLWLVAIAGFAWPLCLLLWVVFHPQLFAQTLSRYGVGADAVAPLPRNAPLSVILAAVRQASHFSGITGRVSLYWYFFDPAYLFLTGGYANVVNSTRHVGVFPLSFIVLIPVGLTILMSRRRSAIDVLLVAAFATAPLAACLVVPEPNAIDRELEILPFGVLAATAGAQYLLAAPRRRWRSAGVCLLAAVPLHFLFFSVDYYRDYPPRAAFWFNWNRRGAIEELLAREREHPSPAIYLSTHHLSYVQPYWRLYLIKYGREDLLQRTVYFDSDGFDVQSIPSGSLLLVGPDETPLASSIHADLLRTLAVIPEPADPPFFSILVRTQKSARLNHDGGLLTRAP
jgi:4-amino-4-deoxy-L-arabinose transferase-like glycosyltransferase